MEETRIYLHTVAVRGLPPSSRHLSSRRRSRQRHDQRQREIRRKLDLHYFPAFHETLTRRRRPHRLPQHVQDSETILIQGSGTFSLNPFPTWSPLQWTDLFLQLVTG